MKNRPKVKDDTNDILFQFELKSPIEIKLKSTFDKSWQKTVVLKDDDLKQTFFLRPFDLSIRVLSQHERGGSEFLVYVNNTFLTAFECPADITETKFIGFSSFLRIIADI